jgi:hypothetical protein
MKYQEVKVANETWYYLQSETLVSLQSPSGLRYAINTLTITEKSGVRLTPKLVRTFIRKFSAARSSTG